MRRFRLPVTWLIVGLLLTSAVHARGKVGTKDAFVPPPDLDEGWYARIETELGRIVAKLHPEQAPQSVAHFAGLAQATLEFPDPVTGEPQKVHYYDGIQVDLAEAGQRFEAGGLEGFADRVPPKMYVSPDEGHGPLGFTRPGRLGMTRFYGGRISAVKFFITAAAQAHLSRNHPCFGTVVEGKQVVFNISAVKTYSNGRPVDPITIREIRVFSIGDPDPLPDPVPYQPQMRRPQMRAQQ